MGLCTASLLGESVFNENFHGYAWESLLAFYQNKKGKKHFPLVKGAAKYIDKAEKILVNEFEFNNETHTLSAEFNWRHNPSHDLEWLILFHKCYYLKDLAAAYDYTRDECYAEKWVSLITSWIKQVPDGFIDSQVTGRRLQQWIASYPTFVCQWQSRSITPEFFTNFIQSVNSQTHYLCANLTPEGNHRTLELYAIFLVAVTFPELKSAPWFLEFSCQELVENMRQDLLPDGVHRELSTDYHHTVLKNYLRFRSLADSNQITLPSECDVLLKKAIEFSIYVHKPDGYIPAINDGDCNSYLPLLKKADSCYPDEHSRYVISKGEEGMPPPLRSRGFTDSGYYILRSEWARKPYDEALYLFFDSAPLGFGSHGHYDALNFEMAAYGRSLIVDPGRYTYNEFSEDKINWRKYFKETAAHNTVVVDGVSQMPYRCGRPETVEAVTTLKKFVTAAGFDFIHGQVISSQYPVVHERMIFFVQPEYWIVTDALKAEGTHTYDLYFHLSDKAQDNTSLIKNEANQVIASPNLLIAQACSNDVQVSIEQGYVSPEYGIKNQAPVVKFSKQRAGATSFTTVLYPYKNTQPEIEATSLTVFRNGVVCDHSEASVLQINLKTDKGRYTDYFYISHSTTDRHHHDFADMSCVAKLLFVRCDESGEIINLQGEGIQSVTINSTPVLNNLNGLSTVSYQNGKLELSNAMSGLPKTIINIECPCNGTLYSGME
jgi:hypothetical protein